MFREIMKIWRERSFLTKVVDEFLFMLSRSEEMFKYALKSFSTPMANADVQENIYFKDQSINETEKDIRKQILLHLSTNTNGDISACLALFSVIKDAERLGDYVKNLFELKNLLGDSPVDCDQFKQLFTEIGGELIRLFKTVSSAFQDSDQELAEKAVASGRKISESCENLIAESIEASSSYREAVVVSLGARYMKRIALHLVNIASSVVNPLTDLDFIGASSELNRQND